MKLCVLFLSKFAMTIVMATNNGKTTGKLYQLIQIIYMYRIFFEMHNHIMLWYLIFVSDLWIESNEDKYCPNSWEYTNVKDQAECQALCEADKGCVGISCSHKVGVTNYCYLCQDEILSVTEDDFGFYRRGNATTK